MGPYYDIQQVNDHNHHVAADFDQSPKMDFPLPGPATRFGLSVWLVALVTGALKTY